MATFDFNSLNRPASAKRPGNPIEIFRSAPALAETPNDLWQGQSKALEIWHDCRQLRDTLISLHTGAGKSIVGLLIAQSLINEGVKRFCTFALLMIWSHRPPAKLQQSWVLRTQREWPENFQTTAIQPAKGFVYAPS